jgi:serine protease inhibitor
MNHLKTSLFILITLSFLFVNMHCSETTTPITVTPNYSLDGDFNTNLFKAVLNETPEGENVVISPISISTVTKMILAGAAGNTKKEIVDAYGNSATKTSLLADSEIFLDWLKTRKGQPTIELSNAFFYDKNNFHPLDGYKQNVLKYFDAVEFSEDFSNEDAALAKLNGWVSDKTKTRIPKVLESIAADEVMFLVNALYLKADWAEPFDSNATRQSDFTLQDGSLVKADYLYADNQFNYFGDDKLEAIELPYKDDEISMYFIKSKSNDVSELIADFTFQKFENITKNMKSERYMAYIPKFTVEYKNEGMADALKKMGIKEAFADGADLSLMAEENNIFISRIIHKTFLTIDEKGTEGAAVTVGGISITSLPPTIRFNSPFVIVLADKASNNILFLGRISNPSN